MAFLADEVTDSLCHFIRSNHVCKVLVVDTWMLNTTSVHNIAQALQDASLLRRYQTKASRSNRNWTKKRKPSSSQRPF